MAAETRQPIQEAAGVVGVEEAAAAEVCRIKADRFRWEELTLRSAAGAEV